MTTLPKHPGLSHFLRGLPGGVLGLWVVTKLDGWPAGLSHAALTILTLDSCGELCLDDIPLPCSALQASAPSAFRARCLAESFPVGVIPCALHEVQQNAVTPSQDMCRNFLPPSEDSASHSRVLFCFVASFRGRCEACLLFSLLLLAKAHPALTVAERDRLKALLYLPGRLGTLRSFPT